MRSATASPVEVKAAGNVWAAVERPAASCSPRPAATSPHRAQSQKRRAMPLFDFGHGPLALLPMTPMSSSTSPLVNGWLPSPLKRQPLGNWQRTPSRFTLVESARAATSLGIEALALSPRRHKHADEVVPPNNRPPPLVLPNPTPPAREGSGVWASAHRQSSQRSLLFPSSPRPLTSKIPARPSLLALVPPAPDLNHEGRCVFWLSRASLCGRTGAGTPSEEVIHAGMLESALELPPRFPPGQGACEEASPA